MVAIVTFGVRTLNFIYYQTFISLHSVIFFLNEQLFFWGGNAPSDLCIYTMRGLILINALAFMLLVGKGHILLPHRLLSPTLLLLVSEA